MKDGRILDCRIKEHKRSTEKQDVANRIAVNQMETKHKVYWIKIIEFNVFEDKRMFLKSRFTKCNELLEKYETAGTYAEHTSNCT